MALLLIPRRMHLAAMSLAFAPLIAVAGLGIAAAPVSAAGSAADPTLTITAGGDRTGGTSVAGLPGETFTVFAGTSSTPPTSTSTPVGSCTTGTGGTCVVSVAAVNGSSGYWVVQASALSGWFLSPNLGISPTPAALTDYSKVFVSGPLSGTENKAVLVASPDGSTGPARGSLWAASRNNPPAPAVCGLKVAMLFDLSTSISTPVNNLPAYKSAATGFVDALTGTPSIVGVYTFGTVAPAPGANNANLQPTAVSTAACASTVNAKINGLSIVSGQATNWDQGLWQIANDPTRFDVTLVLTDGDPTRYAPSGNGSGATTRFIDIENGIFSANAIKAKGTRIIAVGMGLTNNAGAAANLAAISGPTQGSDFFTTDFSALDDLLKSLALANCQGTVNVTKLTIPSSQPGNEAAALPAPGWNFAASPASVTPQLGTTGQTGSVSFATATTSTLPVTLTETLQPGYILHQQSGGLNATCRNSSGASVPVTNAGALGFTTNAIAADIVSCVVYNQQVAPSEITTVLSAASGQIPVGGSASDTATLHNVTAAAGGTVQYRFYDSLAACNTATAAFPPATGGGPPGRPRDYAMAWPGLSRIFR